MKTKLFFLFFVICGLTNAQNISADFQALPVCFGNQTCFTDKSTSNNGPITQWSWNFGDGTTSAVQNPCHTYSAAGTYTVTLIAANSNGNKDTAEHPVLIHPLPAIILTSISGCYSIPTCFTNLSTISSGTIANFSWNFGDPNSGINNVSSLQNPCHVFSSVNDFIVSLVATSDKGCQEMSQRQTPVHGLPVANFSSSSVAGVAAFTDLSTSADGNIVSWNWNFPGGSPSTSSTQNPNTITYLPGTYSACLAVISNYGCKDTTCQTIAITSLNDNYPGIVVNISPNPFFTYTTLHTNRFFNDATLTFYNSHGQQVKQLKNIFGQTITLSRDNLPKGLYFIRLEQDSKIFTTGKLVITD